MKFTNSFSILLLSLYSSLTVPVQSAATPDASTSSAPIVDLGYSKFQGVPFQDTLANKTNTQFLGLRFAAPPTGALRFGAPQSPAPTPGVQIANQEPPRCLSASSGNQPSTPFRIGSAAPSLSMKRERATGEGNEKRGTGLNVPGFSEDCLFLNVYVPGDLGQKKDLPVIFWIHGGGYVSGSASGFVGTDIFDGNDLIREAGGGVIAVVVQYRLGLFGFLPGAKVKQGGALNAGLLDQQFALRWVQQHISKFGGDPGKVTIWGESAGAGSVLQQVVANGGNTQPPLFRGAITSSSFLPSQYQFDDRIPEILYSEVVSQTNCTSAKDTLGCLRTADVNALQAANAEINNSGFFGTFVFVPVVDGTFITERPTELLRQGKVNGEILYSVTNTFEGALFVDQSTAATVQIPAYLSQLFPNFGTREINAAAAQYAGLGTNIFQAIAIMGESIFICPTYFMLQAFGGRAFKGEFAVPPGGHGNDVSYYFPSSMNANGIPAFGNPAFDKSFSESFLNFAITLNTNAKTDPANITPAWGMWEGATEMLFNRTEAGAPDIRAVRTSGALLKRCEFWQSVAAVTAQ
ncbi:Alpha/Beta hydrolase protein [Crassisporium funariophilum]|nr:Alpha/Beta hydrolase protein [Crassisporium funariophilum]